MELMGRSEEGCEERSPSWGMQKDSAGVLEGKEGPALCCGKNRDLEELFSSFLFHLGQQCLSPQSSCSLCYKAEISLLASPRVFQ